jgi:hypothetical protein
MPNPKCMGKNARQTPCNAFAGDSGFCFMHDATKGKQRALARRNGGLSTKTHHSGDASLIPSDIRTIDGVFAILNYVFQESIILDNSIARSRLFVSLVHGYIEALKVGELERRLEALENALALKR